MTCGTGWPGPAGPTSCPAWAGTTASRWSTCGSWPSTGAPATTGGSMRPRLNGFDQFTTTIDGQRIHFLHVRSAEPGALPLIITHGWPGSVVEFLNVIGPLTDPAAHGGDPADAFHLVVPSIPGYGFSGPTRDRGWDVRRVARAWACADGAPWLPAVRRAGRRLGLVDLPGTRPRRSRAPRRRAPEHAHHLTSGRAGRSDRAGKGAAGGAAPLPAPPARATLRSSRPGRRRWPTGSPTPRRVSWPGSPRSSASGPTTGCPTRRSTATSCSPTSRCTG